MVDGSSYTPFASSQMYIVPLHAVMLSSIYIFPGLHCDIEKSNQRSAVLPNVSC